MSVLTQLFTGQDNQTHDIGRWSWALSMFSVIGAAGANWYHGNVIGLQEFSTALGIVVAAHGAALWAKRDVEPKA